MTDRTPVSRHDSTVDEELEIDPSIVSRVDFDHEAFIRPVATRVEMIWSDSPFHIIQIYLDDVWMSFSDAVPRYFGGFA